jgi:hypothetical protein
MPFQVPSYMALSFGLVQFAESVLMCFTVFASRLVFCGMRTTAAPRRTKTIIFPFGLQDFEQPSAPPFVGSSVLNYDSFMEQQPTSYVHATTEKSSRAGG